MRLTAHLLGLVAEYRAINDIRYYLSAVSAKPHPWLPGALLCATNGHQLALAYDKDAVLDKETMLRVETPLLRACLQKPAGMVELRDGRLVVLKASKPERNDTDELFVQAGPGTHADWAGKFPHYESLLPDPAKLRPHTISAGLSPEYLGKAAATGQRVSRLRCLRGYNGAMVHLTNGDPDGGTFTRFERMPELLLLTMGMRGDSTVDKEPAWTSGLARALDRKLRDKEIARVAVQQLQHEAANFVNRDAEGLEP